MEVLHIKINTFLVQEQFPKQERRSTWASLYAIAGKSAEGRVSGEGEGGGVKRQVEKKSQQLN